MATKSITHIYTDVEELAGAFTDFFANLIKEANAPIHVALSGGNTPKAWFDYMVKYRRDSIRWEKVHLFWGDERCVPPDHEESNYGMTKKHLLDHIQIPNGNIHRICGECAPTVGASRYSDHLLETLPGDELPQFDLVILGIGDDGHTASIFPHEISLWNSDDLCVVATHPTSGQHRISLSGNVINNARHIVFLVTGINKAKKVSSVITGEPEASAYPASLVKSPDLHWFLDEAAASELKK